MMKSNEVVVSVEQTIKKRHHVQYISTSINDSDYFMCIHFENRFDHARATVYYQHNISHSIATTLLSGLVQLKPFPYISQCDKAIKIQTSSYTNNQFELEYTFTEQNYDNGQIVAVDILDNKRHHWHSRSWDQSLENHQTLRKNKFLSSSSLLFPSSPKLNRTRVMSSYPDKQPFWNDDEEEEGDEDLKVTSQSLKDELRIEVNDVPELTISLPDNHEWSDKFAQLCVRCYKRPMAAGYVIQILHPYKLMQYFHEEQEETMKLDEQEDIRVRVVLKPSSQHKFIVNDNEWPVRSWNLSTHEDRSCSASDEEDDIFVDGMENMDSAVVEPIITPPPKLQFSPQSSNDFKHLLVEPPLLQKEKLSPPTQQQKHIAVPKKVNIETISNVEIPPPPPPPPDDIEIAIETILPDNDPVALQKIYPQFSEYIHPPYEPVLIQAPTKENGHVAIKKLEIPNHPMGGFLSESTWKDCSIWDIKAVLESAGARKIWDNTFESTTFLHALTPTSSIWHTKMKGAWPVNPRDDVCFHGQYTSAYRIDLLQTSCIGDSFQYKPLPKETSGYIRATIDLMGWRLERLDANTVSTRQILITQFPTWVINFITSRFLVQTCAAVQSAREYFQTFGAPPSLESLSCALLVNLKHDHERKNWRCEYTRRTDTTEKEEKKTSDTSVVPPSTISVIRLDKRRWAGGASHNHYSIVIDPPPSRVTALEKLCDPYGVWLNIEHTEEFIIPLRGKILVLIKPDQVSSGTTDNQCHLNVNGVSTVIDKEVSPVPIAEKPKAAVSKQIVKEEEKSVEIEGVREMQPSALPPSPQLPAVKPMQTEEEQVNQALDQLPISPLDRAQGALAFLKQTDEQFGWTVISENNKSGLKVSKKSGVKTSSGSSPPKKTEQASEVAAPTIEDSMSAAKLIVPDPYMIYKATKVIENFSVDEVTSVVTDISDLRRGYDDTLEHIDLVRQINPGCRVISQSIKAIFPFKNREVYATSCLAQELSSLPSSPNKRTMYVESSIPEFPVVNSKKTRGTLYMSGWILEAIDPYTTTINHPIPSVRVTYVTALDLGTSVPSYISNIVANNWAPKKIQAIEAYLKSKGPPPFLSQPNPALVFSNSTLSGNDGEEWLLIHTNYDKDKYQYKVTNRLKVNKRASEDTGGVSGISPLRRPSTHIVGSSDVVGRRGSLPVNVLPKKRIVPTIASNEPKSAPSVQSFQFLQATYDLRAFTKGYEIVAQLYDISDESKRKNISSKLVLSISEPLLSHFIDGKKKPMRHTVTIHANMTVPSSTSIYELDFSLMPVREETVSTKAEKLTVSNVLGEDVEHYNGTIIVNGQEAQIETDIVLKSLQEDMDVDSVLTPDDKSIRSHLNEHVEDENDSNSSSGSEDQDTVDEVGAQYMGGVAAALGNVSAGVNNLSARMMNPFRSSRTFSISNHGNEHWLEKKPEEPDMASSGDEDSEYKRRFFSREEKYKISSSSTLHEIRLLRRSSDTMRKGMLLLLICLGVAVVFALLMVQPMLERYYASFTASSTIGSLDKAVEQGLICRLLQIPWFGGWDIQIIAIKRNDV
ncbi:uncharacterized protein EV154DRAFT_268848 [Mucor mucedo]|uniref:uncharacterized protein n=1 Tax=Mucor mucedo TaxID=29922 RepID=UPI00221F1AA0|nr:uncharacterized protein EV154DRAFT_268848 [Mucor mucedo]KAI7889902.1 hypothetical protein EV154DRAFT_268848 [Mucor mucedo]